RQVIAADASTAPSANSATNEPVIRRTSVGRVRRGRRLATARRAPRAPGGRFGASRPRGGRPPPAGAGREFSIRGSAHIWTKSIHRQTIERLHCLQSPAGRAKTYTDMSHNLYKRSSLRTLLTSLGASRAIAGALAAPAAGSPAASTNKDIAL